MTQQSYETVVGLECHVQLATTSKMFCGCASDYAGAEPNTRVCPVCLGMPGALPVPNRRAIEFTILTGLALGATIPEVTKFDRKNYPYPDLVKGYQISQFDLPLVQGGTLTVPADGEEHQIRFERVHLEEDTGKLSHAPGKDSLLDFNRAGVPLMEMVTQPDLRSPAEARTFLQKLRTLLRTLKVSDADMEKGQLRCDVNVSLRRRGDTGLGTKVEVKNLNSFRAVQHALEFEIARQTQMLDRGERIHQETRGWQDTAAATVSQRSKEEAHDYRYFPEPDLPPLFVDRAWVAELRETLPELPAARKERYRAVAALGEYDAEQIANDPTMAAFLDESIRLGADPKKAANWIQNDLARLRGEREEMGLLLPQQLAQLIRMVDDSQLSSSAARQVCEQVFRAGGDPEAVAIELGLTQVSDQSLILDAVRATIEGNPAAAADYRAGKTSTINFLKGQVMKQTRGQANPAVAEELLRKCLGAP